MGFLPTGINAGRCQPLSPYPVPPLTTRSSQPEPGMHSSIPFSLSSSCAPDSCHGDPATEAQGDSHAHTAACGPGFGSRSSNWPPPVGSPHLAPQAAPLDTPKFLKPNSLHQPQLLWSCRDPAAMVVPLTPRAPRAALGPDARTDATIMCVSAPAPVRLERSRGQTPVMIQKTKGKQLIKNTLVHIKL